MWNYCLLSYFWKKQRRGWFDPSIKYLYSTGRSAISISWSDFPFVSTTFLFTKITDIKQNAPKTVYRIWAPICSSNGRKSKPTKKFITCLCPNHQECQASTRFFFSLISITFSCCIRRENRREDNKQRRNHKPNQNRTKHPMKFYYRYISLFYGGRMFSPLNFVPLPRL